MQDNSEAKTPLEREQPHSWSFKMGTHVEDISFKLSNDVERVTTSGSRRSVAVDVGGRVSDASAAIRIGNHRPIKDSTAAQSTSGRVFSDLQVSIGDVSLEEVMRHADAHSPQQKFGDLSVLSEHCLYGTLLCLDDADLLNIMEAFCISPLQQPSPRTPSPMLTWQLTNQIVKAFRTESDSLRMATQCEPSVPSSQPIVIPLLTTWTKAREQNPRPVPFVALYTRNYGDASDHQRVFAASIESVDVALTPASVYCVASLLDVPRGSSRSPPALIVGDVKAEVSGGGSSSENASPDHQSDAAVVAVKTTRRAASLDNIQVSIVAGQLRVILPSEELSAALAMNRPRCAGNVVLAVESLSVLSSAWSEISLDGLGYPPFNATKLPRRQRPPSQRLGESKYRVWCKTGRIYGVVCEFVRVTEETANLEQNLSGSFEHTLSRQLQDGRIVARESETVLLPFTVAVDVDEASRGVQSQRRAALSVTRVRLESSKQSYDDVVRRVSGSLRAVSCLLKSTARSPRTRAMQSDSRDAQLSRRHSAASPSLVYELSSDGVEVALFSDTTSIHLRVGSVLVQHNCSDDSGNFSIQTIVAGCRSPSGQMHNGGTPTTSREELVFGVFADPGLWQLGPANYPEKLLSGRWSALDQKERTLFLDMQAYQLHLSVHLLQHLREFIRCQSSPIYHSQSSRQTVSAQQLPSDVVAEPVRYSPKRKTNVKVLIAPSVISFWERAREDNAQSELGTCVWVTCGQVFASVGVGGDSWEGRRNLLPSHSDAVHELNRFFSVREVEFMLNLEKIGAKASAAFPVLEIEFGSSTAGALPGHIISTWASFIKHVRSGSARLRLIEECTVRVTGDINKVVERAESGEASRLLKTSMSRVNVQGEISAVDVKVSSHSIESVTSLLSAIQRTGYRQVHSTREKLTPSVVGDVVQADVPWSRAAPSTDDFGHLRRVAEARHPAPGELVLTESLSIETGNATEALLQAREAETVVQVDEIEFSNYEQVEEEDLLAFIEEVNVPWASENVESPPPESAMLPVFENRTMSWMGMRWCYHIPRVIDEIVANPVPIPPTGMPSGWPVWYGSSGESGSSSGRRCDLFCQLRCWDYQNNGFVIVSEFFVPWERSGQYRMDGSELYEPESFGDFVTQWFEKDMDDHAYHSKLLDLASATRRLRFIDGPPSDKWELRWRSPITVDKEAEVCAVRLLACSAMVTVGAVLTLSCLLLAVCWGWLRSFA